MSVVKKVIWVSLSSFVLSACSSYYASNAETTYLKSRNGPELIVPPPMTTANMSYFYNLPVQTQQAKVSIKPPTV